MSTPPNTPPNTQPPVSGAPRTGTHGALALNAEALYAALLRGVQQLHQATPAQLVGIASGGVWLAERLQRDMQLPGMPGVISSAMHRDDFAQRGLAMAGQPTLIGFDVNGAHIILLDDVLYTGRTIRAALNELFDFGRPASVRLAVLVDRGGRELPVEASFAAARVSLPDHQSLELAQAEGGEGSTFSFRLEEA